MENYIIIAKSVVLFKNFLKNFAKLKLLILLRLYITIKL